MMEEIQKSGKTVEEAILLALQEFNLPQEDVEITILEEGSKGFFGMFGSKEAVIVAKRKLNPEEIAEHFLNEIFLSMGLIVTLEIVRKEKQILIHLVGDHMGILIGKRGQTLDSLQYLVNLVVNKTTTSYIGVTLDTENYRQRRRETLCSLAYNLSKKVKQTKKNVVLEPMSSYERRIIHSALQNDRFVRTYSEGDEPNRNVIITLKNSTSK